MAGKIKDEDEEWEDGGLGSGEFGVNCGDEPAVDVAAELLLALG